MLNVIYKIVAVTIKNRLEEAMLGDYQCGFRKSRSVMDQIFVLKEIRDKSLDQNLPLYLVFVEFKQAYD